MTKSTDLTRIARLVGVLLIAVVATLTIGCNSAGGGGNSDPILSVAPVAVPTFAEVNGTSTGSVSIQTWDVDTPAKGYTYVNEFNNNITVQYVNGLLSAAKNQVRAGLPTDQPFRFTGAGSQGSFNWEIRGTMVKSATAGSPTYIAYFDEFVDGSQAKNDLPLVIIFSPDYRSVSVTGIINNAGDRLMVQHDYDTSETMFLVADYSSIAGETVYYMEHFEKSGSSSLTYKNLWYDTTSGNEQVIMHLIAGTGIIHRVQTDSDTTYYLSTAGADITGSIDSGSQSTLDAALATIQGGMAIADPETEWSARQTVIPDYTSAEYVAAKAAHQELYPDH